MPKYNIQDKVFFITGGAQGFGKEIAISLLKEGGKVFFVDVLGEKGNETLHKLASQFGQSNVAFAHIDVVDRKKFEEAFLEAIRLFGQVDVLLNNAAIADETQMKRMVEINFLAVMQCSEVAASYMRKDKGGKGGRIIAMSSIAGLNCYYQLPVYNATKHGIRVYSKACSLNPANTALGLEYACFHPDASTVGIFPTIDNGKRGIQATAEIVEMYRENLVPIESVVDAFIELVSLETMNGADLFVGKNKKTFVEVEKHDIGPKYPNQS